MSRPRWCASIDYHKIAFIEKRFFLRRQHHIYCLYCSFRINEPVFPHRRIWISAKFERHFPWTYHRLSMMSLSTKLMFLGLVVGALLVIFYPPLRHLRRT